MTDAVGKERRGGRNARRNLRTNAIEPMLPHLERGLPCVEALNEEQILKIHNASLKILEDVGVDFRDDIALEQWREAGASIGPESDGYRVRIDRNLVMELISSIPETITYHARDPKKNVTIGKNSSIFVPMTGAPFIRNLEGERKWGSVEDLATFHKLAHMSPALHSSAHVICEPMDKPVGHRHLWITYSSMAYSDKTFMGMSTTGENASDVIDMCKILFGEDHLHTHPVVTANCNGNSPLVWDESMLGAMREFGKYNQPVLCSPFVLGGANTPADVAATVAQLNAEALSALAYTQLIRKGTPAIYGHYLSTVSMASGAPMAGTPEISLMNFMIGQLARFYKVPWRTSNTLGGAKTFDAQAGYESATTLMAVMMSGANYIWHSAGWNEGGMHCCMSKFVVDAEQCAMAYRMAQGVQWDNFDEAVATVSDIGPGGHYLAHQFTQDHFQSAYFMPRLFDNNSIEQWESEGSIEITERAQNYARKLLSQYQQPELDPVINQALLEYIAKREQEVPANVS